MGKYVKPLLDLDGSVNPGDEPFVDRGTIFVEEDLDGSWQAYGPVGCDLCLNTGYKGRAGIYEVMPITDDMRQVIMRNGTVLDIAEQARKEGVRNLRQSGLLKVKQGMTSLEEIEAVTNE